MTGTVVTDIPPWRLILLRREREREGRREINQRNTLITKLENIKEIMTNIKLFKTKTSTILYI